MRIVFMGTPDFAKASLEKLYNDGHNIVGVFTQPDRPRSRGMKVTFSPVKELALSHGTPVFQPKTLKDGEAAEILRNLDCELIVAVAYGKLLPREILNIPQYGAINIHASLLPKYRGAAPIQWAILNGDKETGVTSMFMAEQLDAGDILLVGKTQIGADETAGELFQRLEILGADILSKTVAAITNGELRRVTQNHSEATYAPPLSKELSPLDWSDTAHNIKCKVRGLNPWPIATTEFKGTNYKVFSVDINEKKTGKQPGEIVSAGKYGLEVACADGSVIIKDLQAPGGKRMAAADHIRGNPLLSNR